jgi:hypothetical protein
MEVCSQFHDLATSPLETVPSTQSTGGWVSPSTCLNVMKMRNLALLGIEPWFLSCPVHSLVMTLTILYQILLWCVFSWIHQMY